MKTKEKSYTFLEGTAVLLISAIVVKIFGAAFKIPLATLLGGEGMGYFMTAYSFFGPVSSVAISGLTVAVSKLTAQYLSMGEMQQARKILKCSVILYTLLGGTGTILLAWCSKALTGAVGNESAFLSLLLIAPSLLFCCVSAAFRGYFEGRKNMYPTAISQVIESVFRLILGSAFAYAAIQWGINTFEQQGTILGKIPTATESLSTIILSFGSAGAILGVTLSTMMGACFMLLRYKAETKPTKIYAISGGNLTIYREILKVAIPVSLCALAANLTSLVDLTTIINRLETGMLQAPNLFYQQYQYVLEELPSLQSLPNFLYGTYGGMAMTLYHFIPALTTTIGTTALPTISSYNKNNPRKLNEKINEILLLTSIIIIPIGIGTSVMAGPILSLIFPAKGLEVAVATKLLSILGFGGIFAALLIPLNSIQQALGNSFFTLILMLLSCVLKFLFNYYLIPIPSINIAGAAISTTLSCAIVWLIHIIYLTRKTGVTVSWKNTFIKPGLCGVICGISAYLLNNLCNFTQHKGINTLLNISISGLVYLIALLFSGTLDMKCIKLFIKSKKTL